MKTYYLSLIDQPRDHKLLVSDEDPFDYKITTLYEDILENDPKSKTFRCMVFPLYIISNKDLLLFKKYAIFIENREIISVPNYKEIIPIDKAESEGIVGPPDYSDD